MSSTAGKLADITSVQQEIATAVSGNLRVTADERRKDTFGEVVRDKS